MRYLWLILSLLAVPMAMAHVPDFGEAGDGPATATVVDDPTKSWVFFGDMDAGQRWYRLDVESGDDLFLSLSVPAGSNARPELWLTESDLANGTQVRALDDVGVEPFTPVALRTVAEVRETVNDTTTLYAVLIADGPTDFALGVGLRESFTPVEWVRVPVDRIAIHAWAGTPVLLTFAGEAVAVAIVVWRFRTGDVAVMLQRLGAGATFGTVGTTGLLTMWSAAQGGVGPGIIIPLLFMVLAAAIGIGAWRSRRRWATAVLGVAALAVWAGLWLGPALLLASALWRRPA